MKRFVLALGLAFCMGLCFAGTLHLRVPICPDGYRANYWVYIDKSIICTFEGNLSYIGAAFRKPDGKQIIVGNGQEWWYEE